MRLRACVGRRASPEYHPHQARVATDVESATSAAESRLAEREARVTGREARLAQMVEEHERKVRGRAGGDPRMRTACAPHVNVHRTRAACARQARAAAAEVRQEAKGAEPEVDPEAEAEAREAAEQEEAARRAEEQEAAREREAEAHLRGREEAVEAMQAELQQGVTARAYCEELQEPHAPHRTTPHRTAPRRAAPRRAAPHACDHTALDVHASRAAGSTSRYGTSIGAAGGVARGAR